jgi:SAM-dependent methyltransferase
VYDALRNTTYQPFGFSDAALMRWGLGDYDPLLVELAELGGSYERVAVDRALAIALDMASIGLPIPSRVLDVGCSVGTVSMLLAAVGHTVTGIDSDVVAAVQDWQNPSRLQAARTAQASARCVLLRRDLREHLEVDDSMFEVVLLLSVLHHWLSGYGYAGVATFDRVEIRETLNRLVGRVTRCLYVETPIHDEAQEMPPDPEGEFLFPEWFVDVGCAREIVFVCSTIASNAKPRRLFRIDL